MANWINRDWQPSRKIHRVQIKSWTDCIISPLKLVMNKSWDWFTVIGGHLNFGLFQDGNIGENIERDFKEPKNPTIAKERKERWRSPSGLSCHFMLLNRILLQKMTPHFVVLIGCIKSPWPIDLRRRNSAGSCKVQTPSPIKTDFLFGGGGGVCTQAGAKWNVRRILAWSWRVLCHSPFPLERAVTNWIIPNISRISRT